MTKLADLAKKDAKQRDDERKKRKAAERRQERKRREENRVAAAAFASEKLGVEVKPEALWDADEPYAFGFTRDDFSFRLKNAYEKSWRLYRIVVSTDGGEESEHPWLIRRPADLLR